MKSEHIMHQNKKEDCFWYMYEKCARDMENPIAILPCKKKCEFFITWKNLLRGIKEDNL